MPGNTLQIKKEGTSKVDFEKEYERFKLRWMFDHGFTLKNLIQELDKLREESDPDESLESIFSDWEFGYGFGSEIWPCFQEYLECEGAEQSNTEEK